MLSKEDRKRGSGMIIQWKSTGSIRSYVLFHWELPVVEVLEDRSGVDAGIMDPGLRPACCVASRDRIKPLTLNVRVRLPS
jgi:hypothetical protein